MKAITLTMCLIPFIGWATTNTVPSHKTKLPFYRIKSEKPIPRCAARQLTDQIVLITSRHCKLCKKIKPIIGAMVKDYELTPYYQSIDTTTSNGYHFLSERRIQTNYVPTLLVNCKVYIGFKSLVQYENIIKHLANTII